MDLDPEGIFRDDSDEDDDNLHEREANKEMVVYLIDASPKMFTPATTAQSDEKQETHFHTIVNCITQSLKTQIIGRSHDEVAICFFSTKEKKNLQDLAGVYVYNVTEREPLDRPDARLIKEFSCIEDSFMSNIGSRYGITSGSRENTLYNALWVAQALLRKGSVKTVSKRILIFTNEDDPFGGITGAAKTDMIRTTIQRAKDAQDLGLSIELLPLSRPDEDFSMSLFYADLIGLEGDEIVQYLPSAGEKLEDMTDQLRKRMMKKQKVKTLAFAITNDVCIEVNTYALIRPTTPGAITWLDSISNLPLKAQRSFICNDTGALIQDPQKRFQLYNDKIVKFSVRELSDVKRVSSHHLRLLGFKPLDCLKDYHNLRPSTFIYPIDEQIFGSIRVFVALHSSMLRLGRFALAFYGNPTRPQLVVLVAQGCPWEEVISSGGQDEPPGMHMIYLPYSDDVRYPEEVHLTSGDAPRATDEQIKKASNLLKRIDLKSFSVCQFANPALQKHYGILEALALGEDEMPDIKDETLPDEEGLARPGVVKAIEEFKGSVYGENYDQEEADAAAAKAGASKKRKAITDAASQKSAAYDWADLADTGRLKDMTVMDLKSYLTAHGLPVSGVPFGRMVNDRRVYSDQEKQTIFASLLRRTSMGVLNNGVTAAVASESGVPLRVVQRVWRDGKHGGVQGVNSKKPKNCGRKRVTFDADAIKEIPPSKRTTLKNLANALHMSKTTLHRRLKEGRFRRHTNAIKPPITEENKKARIRYALSMLDPHSLPHEPTFQDMYNIIYIDEKWFYRTKGTQNFYLALDEEDPFRTTQSKHFIEKVMFLAAVARPRFDVEGNVTFDGKIGIFPFETEKPAERKSANRERGTMETKVLPSVTKDVSRDYLVNRVLPAIKEKWPEVDRGSTIFIQQDNAKTHISVDDRQFVAAATSDGFDIRLTCQPPNSPDTNILDLGLFAALQSLFQKSSPSSLKDIVTKVIQAWEEYPVKRSNRIFLTHQTCMQEIMRLKGEHRYKILHMRKQALERLGALPISLGCDLTIVNEAREFLND